MITVPGEGIWTYDPTTGNITFDRAATYLGNPTSLKYTITELNTLKTSNLATVSITCLATLPITLEKFWIENGSNLVNLFWKTSNDKAFSHFEIEKSENSKEFISIGTKYLGINVVGYFQDFDPIIGQNYYRLKMVDLDGTFKYSKVVNVRFDGTKFVTVENPAINGQFMLQTNTATPTIRLLASNGLNVDFNIVNHGLGKYQISVKNATSGLYYLTITENGKSTTKKILIP